MAKRVTIQQFMAMFPDDDACHAHLFELRFGADFACPRCVEIGKWRKLSMVPAYTCNCGEHVHPMSGTSFHRSHTPLQKWFHAIFLFTTTRHCVPVNELQRQLGVSYETALRMGHEIRKCIGQIEGNPCQRGHHRRQGRGSMSGRQAVWSTGDKELFECILDGLVRNPSEASETSSPAKPTSEILEFDKVESEDSDPFLSFSVGLSSGRI